MILTYLVVVVHAQSNTGSLEVVDNQALLLTVRRSEDQFQTTRFVYNNVCGLVLITKGVTSQDNRLSPSRNQPGDVLANDGLAENGASQDVTNGSLSVQDVVKAISDQALFLILLFTPSM